MILRYDFAKAKLLRINSERILMELKDQLNGFLFINKPKGISSYDCIRYIKKIIKKKIKIGHTGTLDNFAQGLLILCLGTATKSTDILMNLNKEYIATAKLGELTDTLDYTGKIIKTQNINLISEKNLVKASKKLGSNYIQIPPAYCALKHQGLPLYKLIRQNKLAAKNIENIIEQKKRRIKIYSIELIKFTSPFFKIKTMVSKGTYVRSLINDIAQQINLNASIYELIRTKIGSINLRNATQLDDINNLKDIKTKLIKIDHIKQIL
ncbi:tRNA pseudouridine(55) synthase TruB [Candidatus Dependentiae bacterium]|nr:tRNA pseudouridine(55) synthase TruB [Candidatus Dependentiae bacterium]